MKQTVVAETGRLREEFRPAVYFDSSILIHYWLVEGTEVSPSSQQSTAEHGLGLTSEPEYFTVIRDILRS